jgi:hypothetical protein
MVTVREAGDVQHYPLTLIFRHGPLDNGELDKVIREVFDADVLADFDIDEAVEELIAEGYLEEKAQD